MLIDHVANQLLSVSDMREVLANLRKGEDASVGMAQSARPLLAASLWADDPRPCLLVVPGEEAADRMARSVAAWLGNNAVLRYPQRADWPWSNKAADDSIVGARCAAMSRLAPGDPCLVVASARSLLFLSQPGLTTRVTPSAGRFAKSVSRSASNASSS